MRTLILDMKSEVIMMAENGITRETLESGRVLLALKRHFIEKSSKENLFALLSCLRDSMVIVPITVTMSDVDEVAFLNAKKGDTVTTEESVRLKPDIMIQGEDLYFPMFTNADQMPEDYVGFSTLEISVVQCIDLAKGMGDLTGLVLDPLTEETVIIPFDLADVILQIESRLIDDETD